MQKKIISRITPLESFCLLLSFTDGTDKLFDVKPYIKGSLYGRLGDWEYFKKVKIIDKGEGIEWPDGQDIAPHELFE